MAGRILSLQRQARELGRLRTGYTDTSGNKPRPVKSLTWVITSHAQNYVQAAADAWGGQVEAWQPLGGGAQQWRVLTESAAIDAILPPGDPLSQAYELWSGGGCARRCDGITETLADRPCICRAEFGDDFHTEPKGSVCAATTRLNVFLPEMPDVGVFRVETHSYYAASEIAGAVDLIRSAVGPDAVIPIRLRIEQRQRKSEGKTKNFPVVVVELRGVTTGQVLAGAVPQLAGGAPRAIEQASPAALPAGSSAPQPEAREAMTGDEEAAFTQQIADTDSIESLRQMWAAVAAAFVMPSALEATFRQRAAALKAPPPTPPASTREDASPDDLWAQILRTVPEDWTLLTVEQDFAAVTAQAADRAGAPEMRRYLDHLTTSGAQA